MTHEKEFFEMSADGNGVDATRLAYIKPTGVAEARAMGILPEGITLPPNLKLYVLHAVDGSVLGYTDDYDSAYGAAVQNEFTPVSVH